MNDLSVLYSQMEAHLLQDERPSAYLGALCDSPLFQQYPFDMLSRLRAVAQSPQHHPEGNVWNHTLLVVDEAAKVKGQSKRPKAFLWAALLHDIGKATTTKTRKGKITAYDHDKAGDALAREFLAQFSQDSAWIDEVCWLIRYHMQILYVVKGLPFADIEGMKRHTDVHEVALLGLCDRLGRGKNNQAEEEENIKRFLLACE